MHVVSREPVAKYLLSSEKAIESIASLCPFIVVMIENYFSVFQTLQFLSPDDVTKYLLSFEKVTDKITSL